MTATQESSRNTVIDFSLIKNMLGTPISSIQMRAASSSSRNTVTQRRCGSSFSVPVTKAQAKWMASRLK